MTEAEIAHIIAMKRETFVGWLQTRIAFAAGSGPGQGIPAGPRGADLDRNARGDSDAGGKHVREAGGASFAAGDPPR